MFRSFASAVVSYLEMNLRREGCISVRLSINMYVLTGPSLVCKKGLEGDGCSADEEYRFISRIVSVV